MQQTAYVSCWLAGLFWIPAAAPAGTPTLAITKQCDELVPLSDVLPANECFVTSMVQRERDDLTIGATCGKKKICLFSFDHKSSKVKKLDVFEAPWWDEPRLALGPGGDIYLGSRRVHDKQFVFERLRERPHTPDSAYKRRDITPAPHEINEQADGMPIRHYSPEGILLGELPLPESLRRDGVGALVVCADGKMLCGLSSPGGRLFTIALNDGETKVLGEVVRFPAHHHSRPISKALMLGDDGKVYLCGSTAEIKGESTDDDVASFIVALDPRSGKLDTLDVRVPAVVGRRRLAAIDAALKLDDGSFLCGASDGYLFRFDPKSGTLEVFGKPLRQHNINGLGKGPDGWIYGVGGEPGGLARLFAFDPVNRRMYLGAPPSGTTPVSQYNTFGDIGAVVSASDGPLICGERERRGYLLVYRPEE